MTASGQLHGRHWAVSPGRRHSIKPFASVATIKTTYGRSPEHPRAKILSKRRAANNTIYFWDGLIEHLRFPFLKASLPRYNTPWQDSVAHLRPFIEQHTYYPYELIQSNVDRLGLGEATWVRPSATSQRIRTWFELHSVGWQ